jgi:hypothetical protein
MSDSWSCKHFTMGNPRNEAPTNLPTLLRRIAAEIERREIDPMDLLDVTIHQEMTEDGPWWSVSVYWSPDKAETTDDD